MKEYIDKKDAINLLWLFADETCASVVWDFENLPAQDVVEVVRCKYCRYKQKAKVNIKGFLICPACGMEITDDDFCSYGERREENESV